MKRGKAAMEERYGLDELLIHTQSDWNWGYLGGMISAVRWVLGDELGNLDS
jgi:hypothetical protein